MEKDRIKVNDLIAKRNELDKQIKAITYNKYGIAYGSLIREILQSYIQKEYNPRNSIEAYKIYAMLHLEISSPLGVKTKTFTRLEYLKALQIMEQNGITIESKYKE